MDCASCGKPRERVRFLESAGHVDDRERDLGSTQDEVWPNCICYIQRFFKRPNLNAKVRASRR